MVNSVLWLLLLFCIEFLHAVACSYRSFIFTAEEYCNLGIFPRMYWSQLAQIENWWLNVHGFYNLIDGILRAWNWPWREYLHYGNWQMLWIRAFLSGVKHLDSLPVTMITYLSLLQYMGVWFSSSFYPWTSYSMCAGFQFLRDVYISL